MGSPLLRFVLLCPPVNSWLFLIVISVQIAALQRVEAAIAETPTDRYAIVIGVSRYANLTDLQFPENDAVVLQQALEALGYKVTPLLNFDADPDEIKATIIRIGELMDGGYGRETGTLLLTFSGHGFARDGVNYLATGPAQLNGGDRGILPVDELLRTMKSTGIGRQFLFVDACRNVPVRSAQDVPKPFVADNTDRGQGVLYSAEPGGLSYEDSELGRGVFSHFLAKALIGHATTDRFGMLNFTNVYNYVRREVKDYVSENFRELQLPYRDGQSTGELLLGRPQTRASTTDLLRVPGEPLRPFDTTRASTAGRLSRETNAWKILGIAVGVLAVVALVSDDDSDADTQGSSITLVIPTP